MWVHFDNSKDWLEWRSGEHRFRILQFLKCEVKLQMHLAKHGFWIFVEQMSLIQNRMTIFRQIQVSNPFRASLLPMAVEEREKRAIQFLFQTYIFQMCEVDFGATNVYKWFSFMNDFHYHGIGICLQCTSNQSLYDTCKYNFQKCWHISWIGDR